MAPRGRRRSAQHRRSFSSKPTCSGTLCIDPTNRPASDQISEAVEGTDRATRRPSLRRDFDCFVRYSLGGVKRQLPCIAADSTSASAQSRIAANVSIAAIRTSAGNGSAES
jgi:hypothetical protein